MAKDEAEKGVAPEQEVRTIENTDIDDAPMDALVVEPDEPTHETPESAVDPAPVGRAPWGKRAWQWAVTHKKVSVPSAIGIVLLVLAAIPATRYALAGMIISKDYAVVVVDSQTKQPVSSADVALAGKKVTTDGRGQAKLHVPVGSAKLMVTKKYYKSASQQVLVPLGDQKSPQQVPLVATGRQVPMVVVNGITKKPIAGAVLQALDTKAKTDKQGRAVLVVPAGKDSLDVTVEASGYNKQVSVALFEAGVAKTTTAALVPTGKVYFLSNKSGKIDVVKANLDGSDRTVVLAGTGKEDRYSTSLLASRDWRYLALHARRDSGKAKLYLIDTTNDQLTVMDEGNASFELTGWSGHYFVYTVTRDNVAEDKSGHYALKSFNAQTKKITTLDESRVQDKLDNGFASEGFVYELIGTPYILEDEIVYAKTWHRGATYYFDQRLWEGKQATFNSVKPDGKAKKVVKSYGRIDQSLSISVRSYGPQEVYVLHSIDGNAPVEEYENGQIKVATGVSRDDFFREFYPTYLVSPSGDRTVWTEARDGKNVFFVGNKYGEGKKELGVLRDLGVYGWFGNEYLLAAKNGSELYILPAAQFDEKAPLKITDYYRSQVYNGYGYGGL